MSVFGGETLIQVEKLRAAARLLAMLQAKRCAVPDPTPSPPSHSPERRGTGGGGGGDLKPRAFPMDNWSLLRKQMRWFPLF